MDIAVGLEKGGLEQLEGIWPQVIVEGDSVIQSALGVIYI
jgi:hypothetical protein